MVDLLKVFGISTETSHEDNRCRHSLTADESDGFKLQTIEVSLKKIFLAVLSELY